ncbi:hypothetical protein N3K66_005166 [Trichothecium roseum]|uniref:Uncharacterized protein n=1 Tax=Trichothecium roseum TaxID=47278 RepID=A0ACC0V4S1_9HYPO|nr:hypothetical protein N3K66_005166 [Trichothecium roseum]
MDDEDGGLFAIALSDSDADESQKTQDKLAAARRRTEQTEEEYQAVKDSYGTKIENGNIHESLSLPLSADANKQQAQDVVHAVEELYFFRRFAQAVQVVDRALGDADCSRRDAGGDGDRDAGGDDGSGSDGPFDQETKRLLSSYRERCRQKI